MIKSLHTKLVFILILMILALMAVVGAFLISGVNHFYINEFRQQMDKVFNDKRFVSDLNQAAAAEDAPQQIASVLSGYAGRLGIEGEQRMFYVLDGTTGRYLNGSSDTAEATYEQTPNVLHALTGQIGQDYSDASAYIDVAVPVGSEQDKYVVQVRDNEHRKKSLTRQLVMIVIEALLIGALISVVLSFFLSRTITQPIKKLTERAKRLSEGDFSVPDETTSRDEIGILTQRFNHMAGILQATIDAVGQERDKLTTLFLHMSDGVIAHDWDGKLLHVNPAAVQMLMLRKDSPNTYRQVFGSMVPMDELRQLKPPGFCRYDIERGEHRYDVLLAPFGEGGAEGGVMAVVHDTTEQQQLDDMRREFVANVSHELRTPLTNIKSYAETLSDAADLPPEMVSHFSGVIVSEADRMTRIVQDLLTLSRIDYGKMEWKPGPFDCCEAAQRICQAMQMQAKQYNLTLQLKYPSQMPKIIGDKERLEQVLVNIIGNAFKYTPSGGTVNVELHVDGAYIATVVSDNGIGIPAADLPRIFERFYRVDKARARESGGTGLGLSIAKEIVERHGGIIDVASKVDVGTVVTIKLPIKPPKGVST